MTQADSGEPGTSEKRRAPLSARSVLHAVARRPFTLLGVAVLAGAAGAAVWFFLPLPKSTAAMVFHIAPSRPTLLGAVDGEGTSHSYKQSQVTLMKRHLTLNTVLKQPEVQKLEILRKHDEPLAWLDSELKVEARRDSDFLKVTLAGDNPDELRIILSELSKAYLADVDDRENGARRRKLAKLEESHQSYRVQVEQFHKRIDTIALALGSKDETFLALNDSIARDNLMAAIRELSEARNALQAAAIGSEPEPKAAPGVERLLPWGASTRKSGVEIPAAAVENELRHDPVLKQLETEVAHQRQVLTETKALFLPGERPAAVVIAEERLKTAELKRDKYRDERRPEIIAAIRKSIEEKEELRIAAAKMSAGTLKKREELAQSKVAVIQKTIMKASEHRLELDNIKLLIGQTEKLSTTMGETIERMKVELGAAARVTMADEPYIVKGLEGNRRLKFTLLAVLGVFGLGFVGVVGWEHRSRRFAHSDEVSAALGIRLLGSVPTINREQGSTRANHPVLVEAIDATRTMIVHGTDHPDLRMLVVTSAVSGEGKTSLTGHLAISLARAGFRTLLVDGDLRAPTAQRVFDLSLAPGLCEALEGQVGILDAIRPTGVPGLSVLTAGLWSPATRQALVGDNWRVAKEQLKAEFDYIVVDSSPLLLVSDALLLAREADGVVVSVLLGVSQVALVDEAVTKLQKIRAPLTGVIANGARAAAHQYTYGYRATETPQDVTTLTDDGRK